MLAAEEGHLETVQALLAAGADVNAKDMAEQTALKLATLLELPEIMEVLKRAGAEE
jgi:ankyrin repeat protein